MVSIYITIYKQYERLDKGNNSEKKNKMLNVLLEVFWASLRKKKSDIIGSLIASSQRVYGLKYTSIQRLRMM